MKITFIKIKNNLHSRKIKRKGGERNSVRLRSTYNNEHSVTLILTLVPWGSCPCILLVNSNIIKSNQVRRIGHKYRNQHIQHREQPRYPMAIPNVTTACLLLCITGNHSPYIKSSSGAWVASFCWNSSKVLANPADPVCRVKAECHINPEDGVWHSTFTQKIKTSVSGERLWRFPHIKEWIHHIFNVTYY
jgi:hypothetical protein